MCYSCHAAPKDTVHRELSVGCAQCHAREAWKPATSSTRLLAAAVLDRCESCHNAPTDTPAPPDPGQLQSSATSTDRLEAGDLRPR